MIGAVLSLLLGLLPLALAVPVVLPVIGLALGLNAIMKERRGVPRKPVLFWLALVGTLVSAVSTALIVIGINLHAA